MEEKNITQLMMAKAVGVSQGAVSGWLNGAMPKMDKITSIANVLGIDPDELLNPSKYSPHALEFKNFASRLSELVKHTGMSASDVAKEARISPSTLSRYMNGRCFPKLPEAQRLAAALGMPVDLLLQADAALLNEEERSVVIESPGSHNIDWQSSAQDAEERLHRLRQELLRIRTEIDQLINRELVL